MKMPKRHEDSVEENIIVGSSLRQPGIFMLSFVNDLVKAVAINTFLGTSHLTSDFF